MIPLNTPLVILLIKAHRVLFNKLKPPTLHASIVYPLPFYNKVTFVLESNPLWFITTFILKYITQL